jgi:hypothetical protein
LFTETGLHEPRGHPEARLRWLRQGKRHHCGIAQYPAPPYAFFFLCYPDPLLLSAAQGNFSDLFKSIEKYENDLNINI